MNTQLLFKKPKTELVPKITKISNLVSSSNEIRKSSTKLRKIFEKGTYQKKIQSNSLSKYKKRLETIQKQNDKSFRKKSSTKIKLPDIKKYAGNLFSAGSTNDPLKALAALAAFKSFQKGSKGDFGGALGSGLLAAGVLFGPALLGRGIGSAMSRGGAPGSTVPSPSKVPSWWQKNPKSLSRANQSYSKFISGNANIGDRARLVRRGMISPMGMFSSGGVEQTAKYGSNMSRVGKAFGRFGKAIIPGVGAALGGIDATIRAREGDVTGASIAGTSASLDALAAASAATGVGLPVAGLLSIASFGLDIVNLIRDLSGASEKESQRNKAQTTDRLRAQTEQQKRLLEGGREESGGLSFGRALNTYSRVVSKFEEFANNFRTKNEIMDMTEGGSNTPPPPSDDPYTGPISGDAFFPLPGGSLSNSSTGVPKGEYGSERGNGPHSGQDIGGLPGNSPVVAWKTGKVKVERGLEDIDNIITIDHGGGLKSVYKHVIATVSNGDVVEGGQQIARLLPGREEVRGRRYDTHLHFEIWKNGAHQNPNPELSGSNRIRSPLRPQQRQQAAPSLSQSLSIGAGGFNFNGAPQTPTRPPQIQPQMQPQTQRSRQIDSYPMYDPRSQVGQMIPLPIPQQIVQFASPSTSGPTIMFGPSEQDLLNSFYKRVLLNTVQ